MWLLRTGIAEPYATSPMGGHAYFLAIDAPPRYISLLEGDLGEEVLVVVVLWQH